MKQHNDRELTRRQERKIRRAYVTAVTAIALCTGLAVPALAANGPLDVINNLSDFVFACIRAVGIIISGWGVVQLGMSVQSHDASQRTQGFLCLFGGLLIVFAREILTIIGVA